MSTVIPESKNSPWLFFFFEGYNLDKDGRLWDAHLTSHNFRDNSSYIQSLYTAPLLAPALTCLQNPALSPCSNFVTKAHYRQGLAAPILEEQIG